VPDVEGPTHAYMQASPGCWQLYGELGATAMAAQVVPEAAWYHVDCYAVQHPGGAQDDRRQRQSVAAPLNSLCLLHEFGQPPQQAPARRRQRVLARVGLPDWPYLPSPADLGAVTAADVALTAADVGAATTPQALADRIQEWTRASWAAWAVHHDSVRRWAAVACQDRR